MKQEDKKLLIKDLCSRLPYGVKFKHKDWDVPLGLTRICKSVKYGTFIINERIFEDDLDELKPYLRSMSSMTEEEFVYFMSIRGMNLKSHEIQEMMSQNFSHHNSTAIVNTLGRYSHNIDWLNENMFDYRGLIEKGLALEAPKNMYE